LQNLTFTHSHLDHFGFASYLVKNRNARCACRWPNGSADGRRGTSVRRPGRAIAAFMNRNGASDDDAAKIMEAQRRSKYLGLRPPREFIRIRDGDVVAMGNASGGDHGGRAFARTRLVPLRERQHPDRGDQILSHMTPSVIVPSAQPRPTR